MKKTYHVSKDEIGVDLELPIIQIPSGIKVAFFDATDKPKVINSILIGLCNLTEALLHTGEEDFVIVTSETKGIPYAQGVASWFGHERIVIARKAPKPVWPGSVCSQYQAVTHAEEKTLYMSIDDYNYIKGKEVLIIDDVVSSGASVEALKALIGDIAKKVDVLCVFKESNVYKGEVYSLSKLPLFDEEGEPIE